MTLTATKLLWSGEGRSRATLIVFFREHGAALQETVLGVCCDNRQPYIDVIREYLPEATWVFDKFHLIQHLLQAVDQVRRNEARELKKRNPELLKRTTRHIWQKTPRT